MMKRDDCLKALARYITEADIVLPVYSTAFDTLKPDIRDKLYRRLYDTLKTKGAEGADAIAILAETKPGLPDYWK